MLDGEAKRSGLGCKTPAEHVVQVRGPGGVLALPARPDEQRALGQVVLLDIRVIVQVVAGQVGKKRRGKPQTGHASLCQSV